MSEPQQNTTVRAGTAGPGLFGLAAFVTIVLGVLKLLGLMEITWLVVFMPLVVAAGLGVLGLLLALLVFTIVAVIVALAGGR